MKVILTHVVELDTAPTFTAHVSADGVAHARHLVSLMKDANTRAGRVIYSNFILRAAHNMNFIIERP